MSPFPQALRALQELANAKVAHEVARFWDVKRPLPVAAPLQMSEIETRERIVWCERNIGRLHKRMTPDQLSELRIARALYLRMMLASAAARLQPWTDQDTLESMPLSRLLEWTAHDFELLELAELESAMTSMEAGRYAQAFLPGERFLAE